LSISAAGQQCFLQKSTATVPATPFKVRYSGTRLTITTKQMYYTIDIGQFFATEGGIINTVRETLAYDALLFVAAISTVKIVRTIIRKTRGYTHSIVTLEFIFVTYSSMKWKTTCFVNAIIETIDLTITHFSPIETQWFWSTITF
jgi:hypothetical protein